jgi:hypothetical protein
MVTPNEERVWIKDRRGENANADTMSRSKPVYLYSTPSRGVIAELSENRRLENRGCQSTNSRGMKKKTGVDRRRNGDV